MTLETGNICATCVARKNPSKKGRAPLLIAVAGYPIQIVAVDIVGPISPSTTGNAYMFSTARLKTFDPL